MSKIFHLLAQPLKKKNGPAAAFAAAGALGVGAAALFAGLGGECDPTETFVGFNILSVQSEKNGIAHLHLRMPPKVVRMLSDGRTTWAKGPVHFELKNPALCVSRPYTPTSWDDQTGVVEFCVKPYPLGHTSKYAAGLRPGNPNPEFRGPFVSSVQPWEVKNEDGSDIEDGHLVFIAGGTGVTPFLQFMNKVFLNSNHSTSFSHVTLLYAISKNSGDSYIQKEWLSKLGEDYKTKFDVKYFKGRLSQDAIAKNTPKNIESKKIKFVVCGPDGMIESLAGPRDMNSLSGQGRFGGILANLGFKEHQVLKLLD